VALLPIARLLDVFENVIAPSSSNDLAPPTLMSMPTASELGKVEPNTAVSPGLFPVLLPVNPGNLVGIPLQFPEFNQSLPVVLFHVNVLCAEARGAKAARAKMQTRTQFADIRIGE
jgi:hypothetical protein